MRWFALGLSLAALGACAEKDPGTDTVPRPSGSGGTDGCGSTAAFVTGTVSGVATARVSAESEEDGTVEADAYSAPDSGTGVSYELNLPEGDWLVSVESEGCTPEYSVLTVVACTEYQVDFALECSP